MVNPFIYLLFCFLCLRSHRPTNSEASSKKKKETFYSSSSEDEEEKEESGSSDSKSDSSSQSGLDSEESDSGESDSEESDSEISEEDEDDCRDVSQDDSVNISQQNIVRLSPSLTPSPPSQRLSRTLVIKSSSESEYSSNSSDSESSESDVDEKKIKKTPLPLPKSNLDLLLDLDGKFHSCLSFVTLQLCVSSTVTESVNTPVMSSVSGASLIPMASTPNSDSGVQPVSAAYISTRPVELVSSISSGCNLQILYRYTRSINLYSASMVTIELTLINTGNDDLTEIKITNKVIAFSLSMRKCRNLSNWNNESFIYLYRILLLVFQCTNLQH